MLHNLSNIKLQTLITKIFLYYPRENELKLFFDIVKSIGTMLATMLDIEPYISDQSFSEKNFSIILISILLKQEKSRKNNFMTIY